MRGNKLGAVAEIGLEAVVVGGVVAGGQHNAGVRIQFTDGKGDFRRGAGAVEQIDVAAQVRADSGTEFGKVTGEMARIVPDDQPGLSSRVCGLHVFFHIDDQAAHRTPHVEVIHAGRSHAGIFRTAVDAALSFFRSRDHIADGASAEPPRAESQGFVKTVIQFLPLSGGGQFLHGLARHGRFRSRQKKADVGQGRFQKPTLFHGIRQGFVQCIPAGGILHHASCLTIALSSMP